MEVPLRVCMCMCMCMCMCIYVYVCTYACIMLEHTEIILDAGIGADGRGRQGGGSALANDVIATLHAL